MKIKVLYVCVGISIIVNLFLVFYIVKCKPVCDLAHVNEIDRSRDVVRSEGEAIASAAACLNIEYDFELQETPDYESKVIYNDLSYEWIVIFTPKEIEAGDIESEAKIVAIRRDYGAINILAETQYAY